MFYNGGNFVHLSAVFYSLFSPQQTHKLLQGKISLLELNIRSNLSVVGLTYLFL